MRLSSADAVCERGEFASGCQKGLSKMRLSRKELRVIELIVGLVAVLAAALTTSVCVTLVINHPGFAIWLWVPFGVFEGLVSVGFWVAAYGLLFRGANWRPWRRYRIH